MKRDARSWLARPLVPVSASSLMPPDRVSSVEHRARFGVEHGIDRGSGQIRQFDRNERRAAIAIHLESGLENRLAPRKLLAL
jgi:hypothetical protein